jgi:SRSO17 transposase
METRRRASAGEEVEGKRPPDEVAAARSGSSTRRGERTRCFPPAGLLENRHLAARGKQEVTIRFAALRVRPAHRDYWLAEPHPEEWLLIEWPADQQEPAKYWLSTLPADTPLAELVRLAKHRWIIERDYEELKQELGLGHFEGRGWRGFHHHATLCLAAYGFLVAERNRFSPSARAGQLALSVPKLPPEFEPRGRSTRQRTA